MDVDLNAVLGEVTAQRNEALDQVAMLRAAVKQLQSELEAAKGSSETQ